MGYKITKCCFTPGENEQIETVINLQEEKRSVIHGIVKDKNHVIVKDAVVKLFEVMSPNDKCAVKPITHTFTDDCGQFIFGPLTANKHYVIKAWVNHVKIRELVICPQEHGRVCPHDNCVLDSEDNDIPNSLEHSQSGSQGDKIVCEIGEEKIHPCPNNCVLDCFHDEKEFDLDDKLPKSR